MVKNSKLLTALDSRAIDIKANNLLGVPLIILMENAGRVVAEEAFRINRRKKRVAVFCGKGNNGGDGFVAARHLLVAGIKPEIFLAGKISDVENEARLNLEILLKLKQKVIEIKKESLNSLKNKIHKYDLIIDALLGVGLKGEVIGIFRDLIEVINSSGAYILSVDVPSGLDATSGKVLGCCLKADETLTFIAKKRGMVYRDGPAYCGRVVVKDLGVPL